MVDTIRTLSELNQLLADNTTGDIAAQDLRDILASMNVHTEIGLANWTQQISTSWTKIPFDVGGSFERGFQQDLPNNRIINTPCRLKANIGIEIGFSDPAGVGIDVAIFVSDSQEAITRRNLAERQAATWAVGIQLQEGDFIDARVRANSGTPTITLSRCLMKTARIGVE